MNISILYGQTATGKTAKAFELAKHYDGEIINFDSRQIYKKLDIITGKDIPKDSKFEIRNQNERSTIGYFQISTRLWLYDIIDPKESFSSADYVACAMEVLTDIIKRGKTPILVGGTGYYLSHLLFGVPEVSVPENKPLRDELNKKNVGELQTLLKEKNVPMFEEMNASDQKNPRRLIRRIEIASQGKTLPHIPTHETLSAKIGDLVGRSKGVTITYLPFFHASQEIVREKIALRVDQRLADGALEEVKKLLAEGYTKEDPGLNAIGYRQLIAYLDKEISLDEAKKDWINKEVQYAKRQKTYFKKLFPRL